LPQYNEVDWSTAECRDTYTDMFYSVEEERSADAYWHINAVRSICAKCPLQRECLTYAFKHEQYGVWGGLTAQERKSFTSPEKYPQQRQRALLELMQYGITLQMLKECYEYSGYVRSVEN
jgi:WhiB family redox-sensing transcriptional regulator